MLVRSQARGISYPWQEGSSLRLPWMRRISLNQVGGGVLRITCCLPLRRPSPTPGRKPAGLELCTAVELTRWKEDQHRFPPYQYKTVNCVTNGDQVRVPNARERECILGFPLEYTAKCYPKSQQHSPAWNDCRLTLLGNTWSVPVVCYLLHSLFCILGLNTPLTMQEILRRLTPGEEDSSPACFLDRR